MLGHERLRTFVSGSCCHLLLLQGLPRVLPGEVALLLQPQILQIMQAFCHHLLSLGLSKVR